MLDQSRLKRTRNTRGILIGTVAHQPRQGRLAARPTCRTPSGPAMLRRVHRALDSLGVDALVSIGGDDTLKTANKFKRFQDHLPAERAADRRGPRPQDDRQRLSRHRLHLRLLHGRRDPGQRDPQPPGRRRGEPRSYFLVETMGRSAGWLAYGAAIAGEASLVISVEDIDDELHDRGDASPIPRPAHATTRKVMDIDKLVGEIVRVDAGPRGGGQGVRRRSCWPRGWPSTCPSQLPRGGQVRRARPHLAAADQPGARSWRSWSRPSTSSRPARSGG